MFRRAQPIVHCELSFTPTNSANYVLLTELLLRTERLMMKIRYTREEGRKDSQLDTRVSLLWVSAAPTAKSHLIEWTEREKGTHHQLGTAKF